MPTVSDPDLGVDDWRSEDVRKLDLMVDQVGDLARSVKELVERVPPAASQAPHTQTIIHKTQGMGAWGSAAVTACFMTMLVFVVFMVVYEKDQGKIDGRLRDLDAWRGVHSNDIGALKADVRQLKESKK